MPYIFDRITPVTKAINTEKTLIDRIAILRCKTEYPSIFFRAISFECTKYSIFTMTEISITFRTSRNALRTELRSTPRTKLLLY